MVRVLSLGGRLSLLATCAAEGRQLFGWRPAPSGIRVFGCDELTEALTKRNLTNIRQRVIGRAQFVAGRKEKR